MVYYYFAISHAMKLNIKKILLLVIILAIAVVLYPRLDDYRRESLQSNIDKKIANDERTDKLKKFLGGQKVKQLAPYNYKPGVVVAKGVAAPHGVFALNGAVYVSSEKDKALYKLVNGKPQKFADLDFVHDMLPLADGSFVAAVFNENRVVSISKDGQVKTVLKDLDGPNGLVRTADGTMLVSNYLSGTVLAFDPDGSNQKILVTDMKGPAGLAVNKKNNTLYIADYLESSVLVLNGKKAAKINFPGLTVDSLFFVNEKLYATVGLNTAGGIRGGFVELKPTGEFKLLIDPGLPSPLIGQIDNEGIIHLVSPNDPNGYVLKYSLDEVTQASK